MTEKVKEIIARVKNSNSEILNLGQCELSEIPKEVFELTHLKVLRLQKNSITQIPKEISQLENLIELNISDNQLKTLPSELFKLKKVDTLLLRKNQLTQVDGISKLKSLRVLSLRQNQIQRLDDEFGNLKLLTTLLLKKNKLRRLPKSFGKLENLKSLTLDTNSFEYPSKEIVRQGLMRIMIFFILEDLNDTNFTGFIFKIPDEMKIAVKQYLIYFQEYVEVAKGKKIVFEVKSTDDGVFIETSKTENLQELNSYFNEYLGFVKNNIDELHPKIEVPITEVKKEIFTLQLKQQVHHLQQQIELKNFQIKHLERQVEEYYNLLTLQNSRPIPLQIMMSSSSNSSSESKAESNSSALSDIKVEFPNLQSALYEIKEHIPADILPSIKDELELIDAELLDNDLDDIKSVDKKPLKRIKRIFDQITDDDSEFSKVVKKSKKLKESLQKLGKSYNKIAQWLALPNIPDLFLEV